MNIDPKHLAQLSVILETGSFQSAANRLNLTQPALSRNMRTLENRLESVLFQRDGRRSVPNSLGRRLARTGLTIRMAEEQAASIALQSSLGTIGELRFGAPPIVAGRFISESLSAFIKLNPKCNVVLRTGLVSELRSMLDRGKIDFMLGPQSVVDSEEGLQFKHLIDDRVGILCRKAHPLTRQKEVLPEDLKASSWLLHSKGSLLRQQTEAAMVAANIATVQTTVETDSIRSALEIVASTDLITSMPRATTTPYLEDKLVFLDFDSPHFQRPLGTIRRLDASDSPLEKQFLKVLSTYIQKNIA